MVTELYRDEKHRGPFFKSPTLKHSRGVAGMPYSTALYFPMGSVPLPGDPVAYAKQSKFNDRPNTENVQVIWPLNLLNLL